VSERGVCGRTSLVACAVKLHQIQNNSSCAVAMDGWRCSMQLSFQLSATHTLIMQAPSLQITCITSTPKPALNPTTRTQCVISYTRYTSIHNMQLIVLMPCTVSVRCGWPMHRHASPLFPWLWCRSGFACIPLLFFGHIVAWFRFRCSRITLPTQHRHVRTLELARSSHAI
jgi:hypothetical protein